MELSAKAGSTADNQELSEGLGPLLMEKQISSQSPRLWAIYFAGSCLKGHFCYSPGSLLYSRQEK